MLTVISVLFLLSCGKKEITLPNEETVIVPLNVSNVIFSLNNILQKKQTPSLVSLRYWKEEHLNVNDEISLVVNGVSAKLIKQTPHEAFIGSNVLFEIPAINATGEIKATYKIKAANKVYSGEKLLRYVADYNIATVWQNLDKDYVLQNPHRTFIDKNGSFQVSGSTVTPEPSNLGLGAYGNMHTTAYTFVNSSFITGLNGGYVARYDTNRLLSTIEIVLGDENVDQYFNKNAALAELTTAFGVPVVNNLGKKVYSSGIFDIELTDNYRPTVIVKKVRNNQ
mgnify:CR=1 FL=1